MNLKVLKTQGGGHIYIIGMFIFIILFFIMLIAYWERVANSNYEKIDSAVTTSLLSALIPNVEITYSSTTGKGIIVSSTDYAKVSDVGYIQDDPLLNQCYERFLSSLKTNLSLDDNMVSNNPMIFGDVRIQYLRLYEVKKLNTGGFRVTQYYCSNGIWILERIIEGANIPVIQVHSTRDGGKKSIERTSVEAKLELCLYTKFNGQQLYDNGTPQEDITTIVNYYRVAEITDAILEDW